MHEGQTRKSGEPYIVHPLTLASHAIALGIKDDEVIAAMLLHDVVEDCTVHTDNWPELSDTIFVLKYHIHSVIDALEIIYTTQQTK